MPKTILLALATHNMGKLREYELLVRGSSIALKGLSFFQKEVMCVEQGNSFREIAIHKARYAASILGVPALADDSGLEVEALGGAPGIFSARYAGESTSDRLNNLKRLPGGVCYHAGYDRDPAADLIDDNTDHIQVFLRAESRRFAGSPARHDPCRLGFQMTGDKPSQRGFIDFALLEGRHQGRK